VIHFAAARRTREIGIRIALGARRGSVAGLMARETASPLTAGMAAGIGAGAALSRYAATQLFEVKPTDWASLAAPLACIAMAAAAVLPPAWRAAQGDPMTALRSE
jgi:ABC-type antimicrobial peptide transport system permease subunit